MRTVGLSDDALRVIAARGYSLFSGYSTGSDGRAFIQLAGETITTVLPADIKDVDPALPLAELFPYAGDLHAAMWRAVPTSARASSRVHLPPSACFAILATEADRQGTSVKALIAAAEPTVTP